MFNQRLMLYEEDQRRISEACERLVRDANARSVFLIDKDGQLIAASGDVGAVDTASLASLAAGNIAATGGLARLLGEQEFPQLTHEGEKESLHLSLVGNRWILVVIFDDRSSLGLVRLRVRRAGEALDAVSQQMQSRRSGGEEALLLANITDEDIDNLFSDF